MNFKESYIWEFKTYNIFAVSMDYIHCMVFTYIIFGLKNRDWSILWVLLGRLMVWPLIHGQLHNIVIQYYIIHKPLGLVRAIRCLYRKLH